MTSRNTLIVAFSPYRKRTQKKTTVNFWTRCLLTTLFNDDFCRVREKTESTCQIEEREIELASKNQNLSGCIQTINFYDVTLYDHYTKGYYISDRQRDLFNLCVCRNRLEKRERAQNRTSHDFLNLSCFQDFLKHTLPYTDYLLQI